MKNKIYLLFLLNLCVSCIRVEEITNLKIPDIDNKLIVYCLLTPADSIQAYLGNNISINSNEEYQNILDGKIIIKNLKGDSIKLKYLSNGRYGSSQSEFKIEIGQQYFLTASTSSKTITSFCKVPSNKAEFDSIIVTPVGSIESGNYTITKSWKDVSELDTLFYFSGELDYRPDPNGGIEPIPFTFNQINYDYRINKVGNSYYEIDESHFIYRKMDCYLFTIDKNIHNFYSSANKMKLIYSSNFDPFSTFKGIIPEYSNINGGLGLFGGYLKFKKEINL